MLVNVVEPYNSVSMPEDYIAFLDENRECMNIVQKMDVDEAIVVKSVDHIFKRFLDFGCNIESIIHLTRRIVKDSTYDQSARLNSTLEGRSFTRNIGYAVSERITKNPSKKGETRNIIELPTLQCKSLSRCLNAHVSMGAKKRSKYFVLKKYDKYV